MFCVMMDVCVCVCLCLYPWLAGVGPAEGGVLRCRYRSPVCGAPCWRVDATLLHRGTRVFVLSGREECCVLHRSPRCIGEAHLLFILFFFVCGRIEGLGYLGALSPTNRCLRVCWCRAGRGCRHADPAAEHGGVPHPGLCIGGHHADRRRAHVHGRGGRDDGGVHLSIVYAVSTTSKGLLCTYLRVCGLPLRCL